MPSKLKVGDKVWLTDEGLESILGLTSQQMISDSFDLEITRIYNINASMPNSEEIFIVEVNHNSINCFSLIEDYFEIKKDA